MMKSGMIILHDTAAGGLTPFVPGGREGGDGPGDRSVDEVKVYVCGPTVYDRSHLGHGKTFVAFDTLRRLLIHHGYTVRLVQNFTDIEDSLHRKSVELGVSEGEVAERFIEDFFSGMDRLNVLRADRYPRVSEHIDEIVETIGRLIDIGSAYISKGGVFFRAGEDEHGMLLHRALPELIVEGDRYLTELGPEARAAAAEVACGTPVPSSGKASPFDFAVWERGDGVKRDWPSPWGRGRPGWHIECYVMSRKYLGLPVDIQGGGLDLVFPHHESKTLMTRVLDGVDFSRHSLHTGFVLAGQEKMSRSVHNIITLQDAFREHSPRALRYVLAVSHYRDSFEYSPGAVDEAEAHVERLFEVAWAWDALAGEEGPCPGTREDSVAPGLPAGDLEESYSAFFESFRNDLRTDLAEEALNRFLEKARDMLDAGGGSPEAARPVAAAFRQFFFLLGLDSYYTQES
ncbi:hypothetical protein ACFL4G_06185 [Thermodesulfobacteriota bacterium]